MTSDSRSPSLASRINWPLIEDGPIDEIRGTSTARNITITKGANVRTAVGGKIEQNGGHSHQDWAFDRFKMTGGTVDELHYIEGVTQLNISSVCENNIKRRISHEPDEFLQLAIEAGELKLKSNQ